MLKRNNVEESPKKILFFDFGTGFGGSVVVLGQILSLQERLNIIPYLVIDHNDKESLDYYKKYMPDIIFMKKMMPVAKGSFFLSKITNSWVKKIDFLLRLIIINMLNIPFYIKAKLLAKKIDPDFVHFNNIISIEEFIIAKLIAKKTICHAQRGFYDSKITRYVLRAMDRYIAISNYVKKNLLKSGVENEKIKLIYNAVDPEAVETKASEFSQALTNISQFSGYKIGFFGCLLEWKGPDILMDAARILIDNEKIKNVKFYFVGGFSSNDRKYETFLKKKVESLELTEHISFVGYEENIYPLMKNMDAVVHTSRTPEPFGLVLVEAMALGRPVIATNQGGPLEIIEQGVSGLLIPPEDPASLAENLSKLLKDRKYAQALGEKAVQRVKDKFSKESFASDFKKIYET